MLCSCCKKQKAELHAKKSQLNKTQVLNLCNECIKTKREPRYLIILHAQRYGPESVTDYIKNHRYCGRDILASELIV